MVLLGEGAGQHLRAYILSGVNACGVVVTRLRSCDMVRGNGRLFRHGQGQGAGMRLLEVEKKVLRQFGAATFTTELDNNSVWVKRLEQKGLIERHPGGPFGSHCSYYRTELGIQIWKEIQ
jgi:hypothetical protein